MDNPRSHQKAAGHFTFETVLKMTAEASAANSMAK